MREGYQREGLRRSHSADHALAAQHAMSAMNAEDMGDLRAPIDDTLVKLPRLSAAGALSLSRRGSGDHSFILQASAADAETAGAVVQVVPAHPRTGSASLHECLRE